MAVADLLEPFTGKGRVDDGWFGRRSGLFSLPPVLIVTFVVVFQFH
ncbi:hypothetical protein [Bradyrhizobium sp. WSM3983]|nr:hypothetical protein [Bradyrhizobium sp. WSM3983]